MKGVKRERRHLIQVQTLWCEAVPTGTSPPSILSASCPELNCCRRWRIRLRLHALWG